jgi:hypothetical protein
MGLLSIKSGEVFCVRSGDLYGENIVLCGPYLARADFDGDVLVQEFVNWSMAQNFHSDAEIYDYARNTMQNPLFDIGNQEGISLAFLAWLEYTEKVEKLTCRLLTTQTGKPLYGSSHTNGARSFCLSQDKDTRSEVYACFTQSAKISLVPKMYK